MSTPLVLLVSRSASRSQNYREALDRLGISCLAISELKEVPTLVAGTPFNGIMLDMPVLIKATPTEKLFLEDILKALPSAYLNIAPATDTIKLLIASGSRGPAKNLEEFSEICKGFSARLIRPKDRYPLYLQAILESGPMQATEERTVTLNVSPDGCFLSSANKESWLEQTVRIKCIGLEDTTYISATICWVRHWGTDGHCVPGIGVKFDSISEAQRAQIEGLLAPLQPH